MWINTNLALDVHVALRDPMRRSRELGRSRNSLLGPVLPEQNHLPGLYEVPRGQPIEIHPARLPDASHTTVYTPVLPFKAPNLEIHRSAARRIGVEGFGVFWYSFLAMRLIRNADGLIVALLVVACAVPAVVHGQAGESDLKVYGYLQASFYAQTSDDNSDRNSTTFTVQQLNVLLQKDLTRRWSTFVDLLFTNSYSSFRNSGSFGIEQAWVRYRRSHYINVKLGLMLPKFNYLNEIRHKMPVLPYIIRPIVYETTFQEDVNIDEYLPQQAYAQAYGYAPAGDYKIDYAGYVGNSSNINRDGDLGPTGVDTTNTFLLGGRVGIRHASFQIGLSATHDKVDFLSGVLPDTLTPSLRFEGISRVRLGGDFRFEFQNLSFESEFISVTYDDGSPEFDVDKKFYYGTLGYLFADRLFAYVSYWWLEEHLAQRQTGGFQTAEFTIKIPNGGVAYHVNERITFKGSFARGDRDFSILDIPEGDFKFYSVAVSVFF